MKKLLSVFLLAGMTLTGTVFAQDFEGPSPQQDREGGPRSGGPGGPGFGGPGFGGPGFGGPGFGGPGAGGPGMKFEDPRTKAEEELAKKAPEEYAALLKERQAVEEKIQALAKKNGIELPLSMEQRRAKMAEFRKKYEKELKAIDELRKTDPKAAMEKMSELMKKEGLEMPKFGKRGPGKDGMKQQPPRRGDREGMFKELKEAYPEEYAEYEKLVQDGKTKEARELIRGLMKKYKETKKTSETETK